MEEFTNVMSALSKIGKYVNLFKSGTSNVIFSCSPY
jgi:hypothetical protein